MAYLRGATYIWSDGSRVHVWVRDGADHWEESGWAEADCTRASGTAITQSLMDDYVVMRFAELVHEGRVAAVVNHALTTHAGNGGWLALGAEHERLIAKCASLDDR